MRPLANIPMHFGQLHAYETVFLFALAFGPFVVVALVVTLRRRSSGEEVEVEED